MRKVSCITIAVFLFASQVEAQPQDLGKYPPNPPRLSMTLEEAEANDPIDLRYQKAQAEIDLYLRNCTGKADADPDISPEDCLFLEKDIARLTRKFRPNKEKAR